MKIKKVLLLSTVALGMLVGFTGISSQAKSIYRPTRYHAIQKNTNPPIFGELKHSYSNWTFNGKGKLWNVPVNDGQRIPTMSKQQVQKIARHANHQQNSNDLFYLDYTATYKGRVHPTYFYIESYSDKVHGWVYHNGLRQAGKDNFFNIRNILPDDITTPHKNHLTKADYQNGNDVKAELTADLLQHNHHAYRIDLHYATWEAMHLGTVNHRTHLKKLALIKKAVRYAHKDIRHARKSKQYRKYLQEHLLF